jgi:hypothetical protein
MPLQPFAGADPFLGRLPGRTAVLSYLDHRLGPDGPGRLPARDEWPARLRLSGDVAPQVLAAAIRSLALLASGRDVPHTWAKVMPSTNGPVAWAEGPTWAVIGASEGPIFGLVDNRPGVCFDLGQDAAAITSIGLLVASLVQERVRAMEMEPLTRPPLRGLPPLTA